MRRFLVPVAIPWAVLLLACAPADAQRLPTTVTPQHYDLAFDVDLQNARFTGTEVIRVSLGESSRRIILHAQDLQFRDVTIAANGTLQKATVSLDALTETAALAVPQPVPAGPAEIRIAYTGILNDTLRGFYLSQDNGRRYAVTQLESTDARRAFPSFDEPAFKATFSIALTIDERDTAISNGRLLSDTPGPGPGRHTLRFSETPKMSSYLVAMTVGDFQCLSGESDQIPIRICATPDKRELGHIALDAARQILGFYNRYYSITYPFQKLDVVAVPDFAAVAMENTASIFYREVDLLADARTASVSNVQRIWSVLAHEIAHQWFGDLVTMQWWDDLWLNEGFATWMEKRPLASLKPEWKMDLAYVSDTNAAMSLDALASTRAIHTPVETPAEIEALFDAIAYEKGAAVMRMIEGYVGAEVFRTGVNAYLEKHAYGNATSRDFWTAMTAASGKPIDRVLPTFVNQPGVPLLEATLQCRASRSELLLSAQRFFADQAAARTATGGTGWQLPICVKTPGGNGRTCQVLTTQRVTIPLPGHDAAPAPPSSDTTHCVPWAFVNAGAQGYFRTAYSPDLLRAMAPDLGTRLSESERLSLISDEWALIKANRHTAGDYLTLATGFVNERAHDVLDELTRRLDNIHEDLTTDHTREPFERFVRTLLRPALDEIGMESQANEPDDRRQLRATLIAALGETGHDSQVAATARAALDRALDGGASLDPTTADATIGVAARYGDAGLWDRLLAASKAAASPAEQYRYLGGLSAFTNSALIERGLNFALTPDLRRQDTPRFLAGFIANPAARARAWTFVKQHWSELAPKITIALGDVRFVQSLAAFCDAGSRDDIRTFFAAHPLPAASRALDQTLERIDRCIAFRKLQAPSVSAWISSAH